MTVVRLLTQSINALLNEYSNNHDTEIKDIIHTLEQAINILDYYGDSPISTEDLQHVNEIVTEAYERLKVIEGL